MWKHCKLKWLRSYLSRRKRHKSSPALHQHFAPILYNGRLKGWKAATEKAFEMFRTYCNSASLLSFIPLRSPNPFHFTLRWAVRNLISMRDQCSLPLPHPELQSQNFSQRENKAFWLCKNKTHFVKQNLLLIIVINAVSSARPLIYMFATAIPICECLQTGLPIFRGALRLTREWMEWGKKKKGTDKQITMERNIHELTQIGAVGHTDAHKEHNSVYLKMEINWEFGNMAAVPGELDVEKMNSTTNSTTFLPSAFRVPRLGS